MGIDIAALEEAYKKASSGSYEPNIIWCTEDGYRRMCWSTSNGRKFLDYMRRSYMLDGIRFNPSRLPD